MNCARNDFWIAVLLSVHITYLLALLSGLSASLRCHVFLNCFFEKMLSYQIPNSTLLHSLWIPGLSSVPAPPVVKEGWHWHCGVSLCIRHTQLCCWLIGSTQASWAKCCSQEQRGFVINAERIKGDQPDCSTKGQYMTDLCLSFPTR